MLRFDRANDKISRALGFLTLAVQTAESDTLLHGYRKEYMKLLENDLPRLTWTFCPASCGLP